MIGQNDYTETEDSPLTAGADGGILTPDPEVERERIEALERWRAERDEAAVRGRSSELARVAAARTRTSCRRRSRRRRRERRPASGPGSCARSSATTAAPTGVDGAAPAADREQLAEVRKRVEEVSGGLGHRIRILVGKPGLDGHSNGSEQIALRARDVGMEVVYQGIRLTPEEIAESALQEDVDVVGLSILSGSHLELIPEVVRLLREEGVEVPVVVGGIIPAGRREAAARGRRGRRLHAEGLRHQPDHGRDRRAGRQRGDGAPPRPRAEALTWA